MKRFCACPDVLPSSGAKWPHLDVSCWIESDDPRITGFDVKAVFMEAAEVWNEVTKLKLFWSDVRPNIFGWVHRIDGRGRTLAWSQLPYEGITRTDDLEQRYDQAESWNRAFFRRVAIHEIGHALGLGHNPNPQSIMYFAENGVNELHSTDIANIQALYGKPVPDDPPTEPPPTGDYLTKLEFQDFKLEMRKALS